MHTLTEETHANTGVTISCTSVCVFTFRKLGEELHMVHTIDLELPILLMSKKNSIELLYTLKTRRKWIVNFLI